MMHTQEELNRAILDLYHDYKECIKDYKKNDFGFISKLCKINNDNKKYTKEEVYFIGFNALLMLQSDLENNK